MESVRFKPLFDKLYWITLIPTAVLMAALTVMAAVDSPLTAVALALPIDIFTFYFFVSPIFGYVELREDSVFIKFGFILKREVPYGKIRGIEKARSAISDSLLSVKSSFEHVNIKYNKFDVVSVSVVGNDAFIKELDARVSEKTHKKDL